MNRRQKKKFIQKRCHRTYKELRSELIMEFCSKWVSDHPDCNCCIITTSKNCKHILKISSLCNTSISINSVPHETDKQNFEFTAFQSYSDGVNEKASELIKNFKILLDQGGDPNEQTPEKEV